MSVFKIIGLVFKWGPSLISLAWKLYKLVEEYSYRKEMDASYDLYDGKKAESSDKRSRFDILFKAAATKDLPIEDIAEIREAVHDIRNGGKAK